MRLSTEPYRTSNLSLSSWIKSNLANSMIYLTSCPNLSLGFVNFFCRESIWWHRQIQMTSFEEGKFMSHAGWMLWAASGWKSRAGMALFVRTFKLRTYTHTHIDMYIYIWNMKYDIWYDMIRYRVDQISLFSCVFWPNESSSYWYIT
jgi:hypothetical protein